MIAFTYYYIVISLLRLLRLPFLQTKAIQPVQLILHTLFITDKLFTLSTLSIKLKLIIP